MSRLLTAEVRWFWPGVVPVEFNRWFTEATADWPSAAPAEKRIDGYLRDSNQLTLGIKRRGGADKVEIKGLVASRASVLTFTSCASPVELWCKWSSESLNLSGAQLIPLRKERTLRNFRHDDGQIVEITPSDERSASGCNIELASVTGPDGSRWWTLGFEAFGELDEVERTLFATAALMVRRNPPNLPPGKPNGYPAWLARQNW